MASPCEIRLRACGGFISFHIERSEIFHNFRKKIISYSATPNISLNTTVVILSYEHNKGPRQTGAFHKAGLFPCEIRTALPFDLRVSTASDRVILSEAESNCEAAPSKAKVESRADSAQDDTQGVTPSEKITKGVRAILFVLLFTRLAWQGIVCYTFSVYYRAVMSLPCVNGRKFASKLARLAVTEGL